MVKSHHSCISKGRIRSYRFGFNGQLKDSEIYGEGNAYDFTERMYDPRISRFFSVDGLSDEYPWFSPYQFAGNTPIQAIDLDGLEPAFVKGADGNYTEAVDATNTRYTAAEPEGMKYFSSQAHKIPPPTAFDNFMVDAVINLTPIDELDVIVSGNTIDGEKATTGDYISAGAGILLFGVGGKGKGGGTTGGTSPKIRQSHVDDVINETNTGKGKITSKNTLTESEALHGGLEYVGEGARELGKKGSGVYRSKNANNDGTHNQFRIDEGSITGQHPYEIGGKPSAHAHFEKVKGDKTITNNHVPIKKDN